MKLTMSTGLVLVLVFAALGLGVVAVGEHSVLVRHMDRLTTENLGLRQELATTRGEIAHVASEQEEVMRVIRLYGQEITHQIGLMQRDVPLALQRVIDRNERRPAAFGRR